MGSANGCPFSHLCPRSTWNSTEVLKLAEELQLLLLKQADTGKAKLQAEDYKMYLILFEDRMNFGKQVHEDHELQNSK